MHYLYVQPDPAPMAEYCRRVRDRMSVRELARLPWEELTAAERERVGRWLRGMREACPIEVAHARDAPPDGQGVGK